MFFDILVIGGGIAGGEASIRLARYFNKRVALISSTPVVYSRMTLSYGLKLGVKSVEPYVVYKPEDLRRAGVTFINGRAVLVELDKSRVVLDDGSRIEYDTLVLASGSKPSIPKVEGLNLKGIYTFQTFEDMLALDSIAEHGKRAMVIGTGMIGLLVSDSLSSRGVKVHAVDLLPYPGLTAIEEPLAKIMLNRMKAKGVEFRGGVTIERIEGEDRVERVVLSDGSRISVDFVVFSTGVSANIPDGLEGLSRGLGDSIVTDRFLRSSEKNVYAIGDCASTIDYQTGAVIYRPLGIIASYAAKLLPKAMEGVGYDGFISYQVEEAFNMTFMRLGLNGFEARRLGLDYSYALVEFKTPGVGVKRDLILYLKGSDEIIGWQSIGVQMTSYKSRIFEYMIRSRARLSELQEKGFKIVGG